MKAFLEEYGLIVVVCIAFAVLVALVVWATQKGSDSSTSTINGFTNKATNVMQENGVTPGEVVDINGGGVAAHAFADANSDSQCDTCAQTQAAGNHN